VSSSETHAWQAAYVSAVLETHPDKVLTRIVEAPQAIERRLLENPSPDALEQQGINAAWTVLVALKNERTPRIPAIDAMTNTPIHQLGHSSGTS